MKINFLVPTLGLTGGIKAIFEHVNNLANWKHKITIICPFVLYKDATTKKRFLGILKKIKYSFSKFAGQDRIEWFNLDPQVEILRPYNLKPQFIPDADITVATANETADWVVEYSSHKGEKFYFVQDYEIWTRSKEKVDATWKYPLKKIVVSSWLKELAERKFKEKVWGIVFSGVDFKKFYNRKKVFNKNKKILMLYHAISKKGTKDGLEAFRIAKAKHPEIELRMFGAYKPRGLSKDIKFFYKPSPQKHRELYSTSDIFLWPSHQEGFSLPPLEAMACKCAVISTDTGGIREHLISGESGFIVPPKRPDLLAEKLIELIEDNDKLKRISFVGYEGVKKFTWEKASRKLEEIFLKEMNG